jgi:cell division protein FtsI (penicillin-binding protein 3)
VDLASSAINDVVFHKSIDSLSLCLSRLFRDRSKESYKSELVAARRNKERFHLLKRRVSYDELHQLRTFPLFRLGQYKGG